MHHHSYYVTVNLILVSMGFNISIGLCRGEFVTSKWQFHSFFPPHLVPSGSVFGHVWGWFSSNLIQNDIVLFHASTIGSH